MHVRCSTEGPEHIYTVVFSDGEDPIRGLEDFVCTEGLASAKLSAVGTFRYAVLGISNGQHRDDERIAVETLSDVVLLVGDITEGPNRPEVCLHAVLGTHDRRTLTGHLLEAEVSSVLEVIVRQGPLPARPQGVARLPTGYHPCLWVIRRHASRSMERGQGHGTGEGSKPPLAEA